MAGADFLTVPLMLNNLNYIIKTLIHLGFSWLSREATVSLKIEKGRMGQLGSAATVPHHNDIDLHGCLPDELLQHAVCCAEAS